MTSRREAVRSLASIAALPFLGTLGLEELLEVGRRAHTLAELRQSGASPAPLRALTAAEYEVVSQAAERITSSRKMPPRTHWMRFARAMRISRG